MPPVDLALWRRHQQHQLTQPRYTEHSQDALEYNGATMRFVKFVHGDAPAAGFPLYITLHGGGGCPAHVNDAAWYHMQSYYRWSVNPGVYVAPRGVSNTWDLHFQPESYVLIERLIENMVLFENVDPDRVYLLGFSAGGDGVYQLAPRLAQRLAAANMSAGHSNSVSLSNLANLPFLIQVGEKDHWYGRNQDAVATSERLDLLAASGEGEYVHEAYIHAGREHNFDDNDPSQQWYAVMASPVAWGTRGDRSTSLKDTNAVSWVNRHTRHSLPRLVVWDVTTRSSNCKGLWHWLDIGRHTSVSLGIDKVVAALDTTRNAVIVKQAKTYLRILLNDNMLRLDEQMRVFVGEQQFEVKVQRSRQMEEETLAQRHDPRFVFSAAITLEEDERGWHIKLQ